MRNTIIIPQKEYQELEIKYPKMRLKDYKKIWEKLEVLGEKIENDWKSKKTLLELLREARR